MKAMTGWVALAAALGSTAWAGEIERTASRTATITNESGESRLLVAFASLSELEGQWVTSATLTIPLGTTALARGVDVAVEAVARSWSTGATWTSPWSTAGGDIDGKLGNAVTLGAGRSRGALTADVTDIVRAMVEGEIEDHGFLLRPGDASGFTAAQAALLEGTSDATLRVYYRDLRALGYRVGPEALAARKQHVAVAPGRAAGAPVRSEVAPEGGR